MLSIFTGVFPAAEFLSILAYAYVPSSLLYAFSSFFAYVEYDSTSAMKSNLIPSCLFKISAIVLAFILNVISNTFFPFPLIIGLNSSVTFICSKSIIVSLNFPSWIVGISSFTPIISDLFCSVSLLL